MTDITLFYYSNYIWGSSYEFDVYPERGELLEGFCKLLDYLFSE